MNFPKILLLVLSQNQDPIKCSGLNISQYDKDSLEKLFCDGKLSINDYEYINHTTPFETTQNFIFCGFSSK